LFTHPILTAASQGLRAFFSEYFELVIHNVGLKIVVRADIRVLRGESGNGIHRISPILSGIADSFS
jgi:hypothetical protein